MVSSAYIHIPFCEKICHYCDFTKFFYDEQMADDYLIALENEIKTYIQRPKQPMKTIFVGGGTPTALNNKQLTQLVTMIDTFFDVAAVEEYTFEANPGDLTLEKIKILQAYGVNRISMGVQDFDDKMLEKLGRLHRSKDVYQNVNDLINAGISNISIDLMYSLPSQTLQHFEQSLEEALQFDLPHYSAYSLQIEPKTIFYQRYLQGKLSKPPEEIEADMYQLLRDRMREKGIQQYEISNFSRPGFESKHNLVYWNNQYYYGFGAGSHGYLPGERIINLRPFPKYVEQAKQTGKPVLHVEPIGRKEQIEEEMFLGLRKSQGVPLVDFKRKYDLSIQEIYGKELDQLVERGWLHLDDQFIRLTEEGKPFGNEVFQSFLIDDETKLER
ncbi:radical SAM family heme chaperone HemW [Gracilibacillus alcaliphilus]|uniref:radical SAM family heme chaperone HemW n=1 Tax=Gracilibacillus alcaliphilus TaxID=1401441 RepID=UPI0019572CD0|nr:radical SAM family heme chaperone HemW [Gracilibacillus alcaliphilus]MBM7678885.1 oxygen-independent coproporphyrinogen-3 oxidase [Gracilibacillus alcaliphilus]